MQPEAIERLAEDHEFRFYQIDRMLGIQYPDRIASFIFRNNLEKKRLMGADNTFVAKPWLQEIYLNLIAYGDPVLKHELTHVMSGYLTAGPFHITFEAHLQLQYRHRRGTGCGRRLAA